VIPRARRARVASGGRGLGAFGTLVAAVAALALALVPACKKTPSLDFSLSVPSDVASKVTWFEVGVFNGAACGTLGPQLSGGVPASGYVERIAFLKSNPTPPLLQDLPRATYAIAVAARAADCSVVAAGCADVDLTSVKSVNVLLYDAPSPAQGACIDGAVCNDGRCTPGTNNNPAAGAGCSLELIGAGPLGDPLLLSGGTVVSAPGIAATDTGFLIAYREDDTGDGIARLTAIAIDQGGGASAPEQTQETACQESQLSDATGIVFSGTSGIVAEARAGCGGNGGVDLYAVDDTGAFGKTAFTSEGVPRVLFSTAHALASSSAGTFLAYVQGDVATVAQVNDLAVGAPATFGGGSRASDAWVAASDRLVALVAAGSGDDDDDDGSGDDAGATTDAGAAMDSAAAGAADDEGGTADATTPGDATATVVDANVPTGPVGVMRVNVVAASDAGVALDTLGAPVTFAGTWASVSAQEGRVFVASDGQTTAAPIAFRAFDVGTAAPTVSSGFSTADLGPVLYADVAFHQDHVFFAVERPGSIALVAFDHATTTPTFLRTVELANDARVPAITGVRDGRIAVLATDTRVLVAWTTEESLTFNDPTGGYALFACTTP
jgi:hypothetical protein